MAISLHVSSAWYPVTHHLAAGPPRSWPQSEFWDGAELLEVLHRQVQLVTYFATTVGDLFSQLDMTSCTFPSNGARLIPAHTLVRSVRWLERNPVRSSERTLWHLIYDAYCKQRNTGDPVSISSIVRHIGLADPTSLMFQSQSRKLGKKGTTPAFMDEILRTAAAALQSLKSLTPASRQGVMDVWCN